MNLTDLSSMPWLLFTMSLLKDIRGELNKMKIKKKEAIPEIKENFLAFCNTFLGNTPWLVRLPRCMIIVLVIALTRKASSYTKKNKIM